MAQSPGTPLNSARARKGALVTSQETLPDAHPYRILSIDGGGLRGLIPLKILQRLDEAKPNWRDGINMYAGTSTGGLIALGLAKGMTPRALMEVYERQGKKIFARSLWHEIANVGDLIGPKYDSKNREAVFHQVLGDDLLKDYLSADGSRGHVCIAAFDLKDPKDVNLPARNWKSKIFHNIPVAIDTNDGDELAYKVAMRTSAAPTYFASYESFVDGGVFANNPAMCAIAQALDFRLAKPIHAGSIRMLSLGTGYTATYFETDRSWGLSQWALHLVDLLTDGVLGVADFQAKQLLGTDQYARLTVAMGKNIAMDDPGEIAELQALGASADISEALGLINTW
jgi:patatin-like phospholipase/acyl hydrolase